MKTMLLTIAAVSITIPALFTGMHPARHLCSNYSVTSPADDRSERTSRSNADSALSGIRRSFRPPLPADTGVNYEGTIPLTQQNRVENYAIVFSKTGMEDFNLLIDCTFTLRFDEDSTAVMRFGGDAAYSGSGRASGHRVTPRRLALRPRGQNHRLYRPDPSAAPYPHDLCLLQSDERLRLRG